MVRLFVAALLLIAGCTGLSSSFLSSQTNDQLKTINDRIKEINDKLDGLKTEEKSILNDIYRVELELNITAIENNKLRFQLKDAEMALEKKNTEKVYLEARIDDSKKNLGKILRILYKVGGNTYLKLFSYIDNLDQIFRNYRLFTSLIDVKFLQLNELKTNIAKLERVKKELQEQHARLANLQQLKEASVRAMDQLRLEKLSIAQKITGDKTAYLKMRDELEAEAAHLDHLIAGKTEKSDIQTIDLAKIKGKLKWPIDGKIVSSFGKKKSTKFDTYILNNGIQIRPSSTDPAKAVYAGEVVYVGYMKGYGNLIIVQHAKNLYTLYGHCETILKKVNDNVYEGEPISVVGDTGSLMGKTLYFEIRNHVQPLDPIEWLRKKK
ncbi:MAG: murein hydrolase activator EnvC family protein [Candidatus Omnitrophota bacterium]